MNSYLLMAWSLKTALQAWHENFIPNLTVKLQKQKAECSFLLRIITMVPSAEDDEQKWGNTLGLIRFKLNQCSVFTLQYITTQRKSRRRKNPRQPSSICSPLLKCLMTTFLFIPNQHVPHRDRIEYNE